MMDSYDNKEQNKSLVDITEEQDEQTEKRNSRSRSRTSWWSPWIRFCQKINLIFERRFSSLGYFIAYHPRIVLCIGVLLSLLCVIGFFRFRMVARVENLYIPQSSKALKDIERSQKHFALKFKTEEFIIIKPDRSPMIDDLVFQEALIIHKHVMAIPGLNEICAKHANKCLTLTPLEIFQFDETKLQNITTTLNYAYENPTILLSNGRPAMFSYPDFFAAFHYNSTKKQIDRADAMRTIYFIQFAKDDNMHEKQLEWEDRYITYMTQKRTELHKKGLKLLFSAGKSLDGSIADSAATDTRLVPVSFILMVIFCTITLARFRNPLIGHFGLGNGGVMALALGIGAAFGFGMLIGAPYVAFAGVLPFLILGVGIDNIFIITDCLDRQHPDLKGPERIAKAFGQVGASITMTTLTDLVAFAVSMVTDFPAIKYFCLYAALSITFCYLLVITIFLAMLTFDVRRIENNKRDFVPCLKVSQEDQVCWEKSGDSIANRIMMTYATYLMRKPIKFVVSIISIVLLIIGIYGSTHIDQSFDMLVLGLEGSDYVQFYGYYNKYYPSGFSISVVVDQPIDYTNADIQKSYADLDKIPVENKYMKDYTLNWMTSLQRWSKLNNISCTGSHFYKVLPQFLSAHKMFITDLKFDKQKNLTSKKIIASRMLMHSKDNRNSIFRKDMMLSLREDIESISTLPAYPITMIFIYIEQFVIIFRDTIRNLGICAGAILLITLPYLIHPLTTFFVFFGFISLIFELLGLMFIWNVSLNSISMIVIVMAIGFSVDYSAHVAHAFMVSNESTPEKRVIESLKTMGCSVFMGGASTFIGILVTAFASSEIFKIFFKMVFGIVILGLLHGLLFLPVHLSSKVAYKVLDLHSAKDY